MPLHSFSPLQIIKSNELNENFEGLANGSLLQAGIADARLLSGSIVQGAQKEVSQTTTSTSFVDISDTSATFTLNQASSLLIFYRVRSRVNDSSGSATYALNFDGTVDDGTAYKNLVFLPQVNSAQASIASVQRVDLAAGSHTIKMQMKASGSFTIYAYGAAWYALITQQG